MEFELLAHTADVGFRVRGSTLPELFENAARALMSFTTGQPAPAEQRAVEVRGEDYPSLLVAWLNEVLYLFDSGELAPAAFHIHSLESTRLTATIEGSRRRDESWRLIVKAVTYHQIEVKETDGGWEAAVYLDV
jgi:SHS2 domain-containing protein